MKQNLIFDTVNIVVLLLANFNFLEGKKKPATETLYSEIEREAGATPPGAAKLKDALAWNYDLRWSDVMQWDVQYSSCWHSGDLSKYYNSSVHKKWETCRLTAAYLNTKLPPSRRHFKTATCCYIQCALHWYGWVNDDYSYNEARGENISKDLLTGLPTSLFTKLMQEYRKCSRLYQHPLDEWCSNNIEFARCHIQAFNNVCDSSLDQRLPFPRPPPQWMKLEHSARNVRQATYHTEEEEEATAGDVSYLLKLTEDSSLSRSLRSARAVKLKHSRRKHQISKRQPKKSHWLTTTHFCADICMSACAINESLYNR